MIPYIKIQSSTTEFDEENSTNKILLGGSDGQLMFQTSYSHDISKIKDVIENNGKTPLIFYAQILRTRSLNNKSLQ